MNRHIISTLAFGALLLAGCDQNNTQSSQPAAAQAVYTVDAVQVDRPDPTGIVIKASGTVRTAGWTDAKLEAETNVAASDTMTYKLVATPPPKDTNVTQAMQPIEATLKVENVPPEVKTVRVVAETNQTDASLNANAPAAEPLPADNSATPAPDNSAQPPASPPQ